MLPFFRKIRWRLAQDNQFLKYSRYAVGEIVLVVIGILIALYINNWNQERKEQERFDDLLSKVKDELKVNFNNLTESVSHYRQKDSLIFILKNRRLTYDQLVKNKRVIQLLEGFQIYTIQNEAFKNLSKIEIHLNEDQDSILRMVTDIYINELNVYLKLQERFLSYTVSHQNQLARTKPWFSKVRELDNWTEEIYGYYLNDPFFYNHLDRLGALYVTNLFSRSERIRIATALAYKLISNYFNAEEDLLRYDIEDYNHYIGTYKDSVTEVKIKSKDGKLFYSWNSLYQADSSWIYPVSKTFFQTGHPDGFYFLILDANNEVKSQRWSNGTIREEYVKINDN